MLKESTISFSAATVRGTKIVAALILFFGLQFDARADISAYMITIDRNLGTIDLNSGVFTQIGPTDSGPSNPIELAGLGEINSSPDLFGASYAAGEGTLYTIDPTTGNLTTVGTYTAAGYLGFGSTLTGLYAIVEQNTDPGAGNADLYSVDPTTGQATEIGDTGLALGGDYTLSTNSSTLYFALGADLYTLNTSTGLPTLVGSTGGAQFGGLVTEGSVLYGGQFNSPAQVDILASNGTASSQSPTADLSGTSSDFGGLAPIPATTVVPEPSSFSLLLLVVLSAGILIIKARRQTAADPD
jgi:hypothetical protein